MRRAILALALVSSLVRATPYDAFFESFVLIDTEGAAVAGRVPESGKSPFGALVAVDPSGQVGLCSVTHLVSGVVITAAHCIRPSLPVGQHFIVFYAAGNRKVATAVESFRFVGDATMDVAVLTIPKAAAIQWDTAGNEIKSYDARQLASAFRDESVTLWSYTPLSNFPRLMEKFPKQVGMVFSPNRCKASRIMPKIEAMQPDPKTNKERKAGEVILVGDGKIEENKVLFVDDCARRIVSGNSGSLMTSSADFSKKVGVLYLFVTDKDKIWEELEKLNRKHGKLSFYYRGNDDRPKPITWGYGDFWIGAGIVLENLTKIKPGILD